MKSKSSPRSTWSILSKVVLLAVLLGAAVTLGVGVRSVIARHGEATGDGADNWVSAVKDLGQIAFNPRAGFDGKSRINILCMGIDDNWTNSDVVYTRGARTDTLFMLSLDLANKKAAILSIPRDADVPIAGTNYRSKINSAYATGGPKRAEATVARALDVVPDHYIVIKIDGTKKMVDALGGVDVNVEHNLDYDDNWGHLHVHLKPGFQHLSGDDAVGYARYRHGNRGVTPEDGDERRIYRQHVLVRAMLDRFKNIANVVKPNALIDTAMSCIVTDMSRTQLFDLGVLFHGIDQDDIVTAQIPGKDSSLVNGAYVMELDQDKMNLLVDWLLRGNDSSGRAATSVIVKNATRVNGLALSTGESIKQYGYTDVRAGTYQKKGVVATSAIVDTGVPNRQAAKEIAGILGLAPQAIVRETPKPNKVGWTAPPAVTVILGSDYAAAHPGLTGAASSGDQAQSTATEQ